MTRRRVSAREKLGAAFEALPLPRPDTPAYDLLRELGVDVDKQSAAQAAERERQRKLTHAQAVEEYRRNIDPRTGRYLDTHDWLMKANRSAIAGMQRRGGRPPKPENSNDKIIALLREHRPLDFKGRFTLARAEATRKWLERRKIYKSTDAITKMVNRAKPPK